MRSISKDPSQDMTLDYYDDFPLQNGESVSQSNVDETNHSSPIREPTNVVPVPNPPSQHSY